MADSRGTSRRKSAAAPRTPADAGRGTPASGRLVRRRPAGESPRTPADARRWVEEHGVVVESAKAAVPSLALTIAGEPIRGSWWSHPKAQLIFALAEAIRDCEDIVTCRLVDGKITFVHRRLWPALVRLQNRFEKARLAKVVSEHTPSGKHITHETPFPKWVPRDVIREGQRMSEEEAGNDLAAVIPDVNERSGGSGGSKGDKRAARAARSLAHAREDKSEHRPPSKRRRG